MPNLFLKQYLIIILQDHLAKADYPKINLKACANSDYPGIIFDSWNDRKPFRATLPFGGGLTDISFQQTRQSFYKCLYETDQQLNNYDCMAQLMSHTNATTCQKNCINSRATQGKDYSIIP